MKHQQKMGLKKPDPSLFIYDFGNYMFIVSYIEYVSHLMNVE